MRYESLINENKFPFSYLCIETFRLHSHYVQALIFGQISCMIAVPARVVAH